MLLPGADEVVVNGDGFGKGLLHAGGVVAERVAVRCSFGAGAKMEHGAVAVEECFFRLADFMQQPVPVFRCHISRQVHRAAIVDDERRFLVSLCNLPEGILHLEQESHHALVYLEIEVPVMSQEICAGLDEKGGRFGQGEHDEPHFGEKFLDALVGGGFPGTGTAGEYDFGDH